MSMAYFNYHAKAKRLIKDGFLIGYEFVNEHNNVRPALILYFHNNKPIPIKQHYWKEYLSLIKEIQSND